MKRWWVCLLALLLLLPATGALAGRGGNIKLSRGMLEVAVGTVPIYLQALQHGTYPVDDALIVARAKRPDGTEVLWTATKDPTYGNDNVYLVMAAFDQPGDWKLTFEASQSMILFPPLERTIPVRPAGTKVGALGPITIMERGHLPSGAPGQVEKPALEPTYTPAPLTAGKLATPALAGGAVVAGLGALLFWRRRRAAVR